ncbi:MAG: sugar transferase [Kiritimatiellae bacterium]|nr:sugar transferase [Kiritimatiellia bacterium]MDD5523069.1 sugar transferase [Kiritimatiellia bacterium]
MMVSDGKQPFSVSEHEAIAPPHFGQYRGSVADFHNMCILDVYYLRNRNWVLDLKIMLKTVWVVLFAKGAY